MKFVALIDYADDEDAAQTHFAEHRVWLRGLLAEGRLAASGMLAEGAGAVWVYDAATLEDARALVEQDPYFAAGVSVEYDVRPLHHWSAKAAVGAT